MMPSIGAMGVLAFFGVGFLLVGAFSYPPSYPDLSDADVRRVRKRAAVFYVIGGLHFTPLLLTLWKLALFGGTP